MDQHSRKGKGFGSVTLIWDGWLDAALSTTFLFYVVSISESRHFFVSAMSREFCSHVAI